MSIVTKNIIINDNASNALQINGGIGVSHSVNVGGDVLATTGTITGNSLSATNALTMTDGENAGTIDQISTELTLSSNGNKVALSSGNSLIFKNDNSIQLNAYTGKHKIDPVHIHGFLRNITIIKQTVSLQNPNLNLINLTSPIFIVQNIGTLQKGQVINGAFLWVTQPESLQIGLYTQADRSLVASNNLFSGTGLIYPAFSSSYIVPSTQVYFIGMILSTTTLRLSHNYYNFGRSASTTALSANTQTATLIYSLPSSLSGITFTTSNHNYFIGVYA